MFVIAFGQCTGAMKARLESEDNFSHISKKGDVVLLFKMIRSIAFNYELKQYPHLAVFNSMRSFYMNYQKNYQTCDTYLDNFNNLKEVIKHCGGNATSHDSLIGYTLK